MPLLRGDSGQETGRENLRLESARNPLPRNGDTRPPDGLIGRVRFASNSLIIVNDVFLCSRVG